MSRCLHPGPAAFRTGSNRLFRILALYLRSPESGGLCYTSGQLKKPIYAAGGTVAATWCSKTGSTPNP